jgi:tetratricopeptide (TPR) repeat protein
MKPARNDPCPCGSGRKYKKCCGQADADSATPAYAVPSRVPAAAVAELTALAAAGRAAELESRARALLSAHPTAGIAWKALGVALLQQRKRAVEALEEAARWLPGDVETHSNLGAAWRAAGQLEQAAASYRRALEINPAVAEVHSNYGNVLRELGRLSDALAHCRAAVELKPRLAPLHNNLGNTLQELGELDAAVVSYRRALSLQADYPDALTNLGITLRVQGLVDDAEACCLQALERRADHPPALRLLADLNADRGRFGAAEELFQRCIALEPEGPDAWAGIAGLRRLNTDDADWLAGVQQLAERPLPARQEACLRYALGKYFDDVGDFERAFGQYAHANQLARTYHQSYDRRALTESVDLIIATYDAAWLRRVSEDQNLSPRPVLIVGLPRSGTSLAEQILASHPAIHGAGELPFWRATLPRQASAAGGSDRMDALDGAALRRIGAEYLALLERHCPERPRVIDKMPGNFSYLGLIHAALPNARIIHMRRDPLDMGLSIYFQNFSAVHSYASDLGDIGHYYGEYRRLMQHWRELLPADRLLDVPYEGLLDDLEGWSRRMLEFLGLPWDPGCLEFQNTSRSVSTFSKWQTRQKISHASVGRWRHYANAVEPLRRALESAGDI